MEEEKGVLERVLSCAEISISIFFSFSFGLAIHGDLLQKGRGLGGCVGLRLDRVRISIITEKLELPDEKREIETEISKNVIQLLD